MCCNYVMVMCFIKVFKTVESSRHRIADPMKTFSWTLPEVHSSVIHWTALVRCNGSCHKPYGVSPIDFCQVYVAQTSSDRLWIFSCLLQLDAETKALEQTLQWKFFTPVCTSWCLLHCHPVGKVFWQNWQVFRNGTLNFWCPCLDGAGGAYVQWSTHKEKDIGVSSVGSKNVGNLWDLKMTLSSIQCL